MPSLFDNIRKPWAAWEMTMEAHDPVNNLTLDMSGNGRHLTFGDGSTPATFPTKLTAKRGYQNASNQYFQLGSNAWSSNRITVEVLMQCYTRDTSGYIFDFRNGTTSQCNIGYTSGEWYFNSGPIAAAAKATKAYAYPQKGITQIVGRYNGTATDLFLEGSLIASAATPAAPEAGAAASGRVFQSYAGATQYNGMYSYLLRLWDLALTDTEIQELSRKAKEELHRI